VQTSNELRVAAVLRLVDFASSIKSAQEPLPYQILQQEFITPYTPEHNGLVERWFRSLKEECLATPVSKFCRRTDRHWAVDSVEPTRNGPIKP
jgi:hypothetical protein